MSEGDFVLKEIDDNPEAAAEAWRLYKGLKIGALLDVDFTVRTTDWMRYFYIQGYLSGKSKEAK